MRTTWMAAIAVVIGVGSKVDEALVVASALPEPVWLAIWGAVLIALAAGDRAVERTRAAASGRQIDREESLEAFSGSLATSGPG